MAVPRFKDGHGTDTLLRYLDRMGHPERTLKVVHVAGTNGKGSVCAFLEAVLRRKGCRTGFFSSPHLVTMRERFRINYAMCPEEDLIKAWEEVRTLMEAAMADGLAPLTFFEIMFVMALCIFRDKRPDYCIMETGLGGRLDATNVCLPVLCVITSISLDHTEILGDTVEKIAAEKAGIIKPGVPVVFCDENNGAAAVIREYADRAKAPCFSLKESELTICEKTENTIDFFINNRYYKSSRIQLNTWAEYQVFNAGLAALALRVLFPDLEDRLICQGLSSMYWEGRMEELRPRFFVDGAHNPGAVRKICGMLKESDRSWRLLFAVCSDKSYSEMIRMLADIPFRGIYITAISGYRAAKTELIEKEFRRYTDGVLHSFSSVKEAVNQMLLDQKDDEYCLCLGSLYLVGEIRQMLEEIKVEREVNYV